MLPQGAIVFALAAAKIAHADHVPGATRARMNRPFIHHCFCVQKRRPSLDVAIMQGIAGVACFVTPLFQNVPTCATAAPLVFVGCLMMGSVGDINWQDLETEEKYQFFMEQMEKQIWSLKGMDKEAMKKMGSRIEGPKFVL